MKQNYEYNNILDVYQHSKSLKSEKLANFLGLKLIANTSDTEYEMLVKFRDQLMQIKNKQKCKQLEGNSFDDNFWIFWSN